MGYRRDKFLRLDTACLTLALIIASCTGIQADSKLLFVGCGGLCVLDPEPDAVPSAITWETPERDFTDTAGKVLFTGVPIWDGESISNAVWSPDGTVLAVTTVWGLDGQNSILTVQPDGTNAEAIVTHPCCVALLPDEEGWGDPVPRFTKSNLSWSPEGDRLAYVSDIGNIDIYRVDGTRERFFPALPVADRPWFDWGPSGLMYFSDVGKPVYTIHLDGSGLDSLAISGYAFEVSPDGQTLAYTTGDPDHQIHLLDTDTRESTYLTDGYGPEWSPDGRMIAFLQNSAIRIIKPDGSGEQIIYEGDLFGEIDWSPRLSSPTSVTPTSWGSLKTLLPSAKMFAE